MDQKRDKRFEQRIRFVARHYREGRLDTEEAWQRIAARHAGIKRMHLRRFWLRAAAVLLLLLGIGTAWWIGREQEDWVMLAAGPGEVREICLSDRTLVSLAGGARIRYDRKAYGKKQRRVELEGKAFFDVSHDPDRPFSVQAHESRITVLGTRFQVSSSPTSDEVRVVSGKVCFAPSAFAEQAILTAGMSASYSVAAKRIDLSMDPADDPNFLAWKTQVLHFDNAPIEQVIKDLRICYQTNLRDRSAGNGQRLTATYDHLPLEVVLRLINQTLGTQLEIVP